jgi:hypothetical protein
MSVLDMNSKIELYSLIFQDILDVDLFWSKEMLRADDDLLFSCGVMDPKSINVSLSSIQGKPVFYT